MDRNPFHPVARSSTVLLQLRNETNIESINLPQLEAATLNPESINYSQLEQQQ